MTAAARFVLGDSHGDIVDDFEPACTRYVEEPPRTRRREMRGERPIAAYRCLETGDTFATARDFWETMTGEPEKPTGQPALRRAAREGSEVCGVHVRETTVSGAMAAAILRDGWAPAERGAAC